MLVQMETTAAHAALMTAVSDSQRRKSSLLAPQVDALSVALGKLVEVGMPFQSPVEGALADVRI